MSKKATRLNKVLLTLKKNLNASFPRLMHFLRVIKQKLFPSFFPFIKSSSGDLIPNPKVYSAWVRELYHQQKDSPTNNIPLLTQHIQKAIAQSIQQQPTHRNKQFFLDISVLIHLDHGTGVQRVVKNMLTEFLNSPPKGYHVEPVYGDVNGIYHYARSDEAIDTFSGDVFLGLDLLVGCIPRYRNTFDHFKACGTKLYFIIYDLLPIHYPAYFKEDIPPSFTIWLTQITEQADGVVCISKTVADHLIQWLDESNVQDHQTKSRTEKLKIGWFHLGSDMRGNKPISQENLQTSTTLFSSVNFPSVLMVSTIEPRKGYVLALAAFEKLWQQGEKIHLIIVGQPGWKMNDFIKKLSTHPEKNKQLFWFEQIDDNQLAQLYKTSQGLLMASECEGFGLALIEAAHYQLPLLVRDIPIFREVAGDHARYFPNNNSAHDLACSIKQWIDDISQGLAPKSTDMPRLSWSQSMLQLCHSILDNQWYQT